MKNYLYVFRHAPFGSSMGQEGLDAVLVAASFEKIKISVLFMEDGIYQLKTEQNNDPLKMKLYTKGFAALKDFDIENICVHDSALSSRGLSEKDLTINVQLIDDKELSELFHQQQRVFGF